MKLIVCIIVLSVFAWSCGGGGEAGAGGSGGSSASSGATCSPTNCTGCCFNGSCQPGNTAAGCGKSGATCAVCASPQVCKVDQICGVDPGSMWRVTPNSAVITTTNQGASWDTGGGAPDPYVNMYCPASAAAPTSTAPFVADTFTPMWNTGGCTMSAKDLMTFGVGVEVGDDDITIDDSIAAKAAIYPSEQDLLAGGMVITNNLTLTSLTLLLTQQ